MDLLSKAPKLAWGGGTASEPCTANTQPDVPATAPPPSTPSPPPTVPPPPPPSPTPTAPAPVATQDQETSTSTNPASVTPQPSSSTPEPSGSKDALQFVEPFFKTDTTFDSFRFLKTLGRGTFGKVKLAEHIQTHRKVAVKLIEKANIKTEKQKNCVKRELRLMVLLHHPHIIEVKDVIETDSKIGIVMEYAEHGELFDYIVQKKCLSEREARDLFQQILSAIEYCHDHCIIHRDLKPENLLLDKDMKVKLVDFGFGNTFDNVKLLDTFCGSPFYAAPEMIKGICYSGPGSDIWSLGVILYAMLCGKLPFDAKDLRKLYEKIAAGVFKCPSHLSTDAVDLLHSMIRVDPRQRASLDRIKRHPWLQPMAFPHTPFVLRVHPPLNPVYVDLIASFGFPKDTVVSLLTDALRHPPKHMHPALGYYALLSVAPLVQAKLKSTSTDSMYSSLSSVGAVHAGVAGVRKATTTVSFQTWSLATEVGPAEVVAALEDVLNQAKVAWKFDKNVFSCKKEGKRFDVLWAPAAQAVYVRQMHGTGCGAFCSYLLAELKRHLDGPEQKTNPCASPCPSPRRPRIDYEYFKEPNL